MREHTKYISYGSHGFKEKDFLSFSHYKSMENLDPKGGASLDHRGLIGRIYVDNQKTLLCTKYISCDPHSFREDYISFSHYKSMRAICCHGNQSSNLNSPKSYCNLSPCLMMLCMIFDQNCFTDFRDILL